MIIALEQVLEHWKHVQLCIFIKSARWKREKKQPAQFRPFFYKSIEIATGEKHAHIVLQFRNEKNKEKKHSSHLMKVCN